ncbi:tetratricopeptide repeat family protein [Desulfovibrio ferrophilus]|uniref:Tetratricopeptide repeat family protein n=1 Tax=Desulfovibrio ferrophilus TaxID=241368 RepID=A0A2Z6AUQ0_9BACT|nr:tetratricopeptide repeat family protein [Desulfovibrio ferrophilus]
MAKGEVVSSVEHFSNAVREMMGSQIFGREKFEVEVHAQEYLKDFNRHPDIKKFFADKNIHVTPYVKFTRGEERALLEAIEKILGEMNEGKQQADQAAEVKKERRKEELLEKGQYYLDKKEFPKGKSILRGVAEEFGHEDGVRTDIGRRLLKAGLYFEAGEVLEEAIGQNSRDSHALAFAVQAYKNAREYPKMEKMYKIALKSFGSHPKTLLHMAEMYLDWRKYDEAYDFAKQAFDGDTSLTEAQEIIDTCGKRIFKH